MEKLLIGGGWQVSDNPGGSFRAEDPATGQPIGPEFPVSGAADVEFALTHAEAAAKDLAAIEPERIAGFLDAFASGIEASAPELAEVAHRETALGVHPRLYDVELPRTVNQLRQAAAAARSRLWSAPTIDTQAGLRARYAPLSKPVVVFGPNNFPFAFNAVSGGDCAAALAAGNPVIAKCHPAHPQTCRQLAKIAQAAVQSAGLPMATIQILYHMPPELGLKLVSDSRVGAVGFTGSRAGGLALKRAADEVGIPVYAEMSSINPVFILSGALAERGAEIASELATSCLAGVGQFCTNPGFVVIPRGGAGDTFVSVARRCFEQAEPGVLLARGVLEGLVRSVDALRTAGARVLCGGHAASGAGYRYSPTLLSVDADHFAEHAAALQQEAFGPVSLFIRTGSDAETESIARALEGNLTGCVYSARDGSDDVLAERLMKQLRPRVGRLLNDRMPTGVAVSAAMNHGGPYPATSHSGFTSVGFPAAIRRFATLECYDHVREAWLPPELRDRNPDGGLQRCIDGVWTTADVAASTP
ncbi:MAG: aldehyde dehydrogenase family protein [Nevskiaceae bacterium]|nr:MAG: aldehyde dehydrogenase family protein [Nevskiaceae bacterium]TBR72669.1 MAG: aldehyde dehydrogenase family protein [Nevskiaceae bacterium]